MSPAKKTHPPAGRQTTLVPMALVAMALLALVGAAVVVLRPAPAAASGQAAPPATQAPAGTRAAQAPAPAGAARTPVTAQDGVVRLPAADLADGRAHFYTYKGAGKQFTFFVLKSSDGVIRAAFDACDVCYPAKKGYHQEGDVMVCNNCGTRFPSVRINVETGGCNPAPLDVQAQGDAIVIQAAAIEAGARYF